MQKLHVIVIDDEGNLPYSGRLETNPERARVFPQYFKRYVEEKESSLTVNIADPNDDLEVDRPLDKFLTQRSKQSSILILDLAWGGFTVKEFEKHGSKDVLLETMKNHSDPRTYFGGLWFLWKYKDYLNEINLPVVVATQYGKKVESLLQASIELGAQFAFDKAERLMNEATLDEFVSLLCVMMAKSKAKRNPKPLSLGNESYLGDVTSERLQLSQKFVTSDVVFCSIDNQKVLQEILCREFHPGRKSVLVDLNTDIEKIDSINKFQPGLVFIPASLLLELARDYPKLQNLRLHIENLNRSHTYDKPLHLFIFGTDGELSPLRRRFSSKEFADLVVTNLGTSEHEKILKEFAVLLTWELLGIEAENERQTLKECIEGAIKYGNTPQGIATYWEAGGNITELPSVDKLIEEFERLLDSNLPLTFSTLSIVYREDLVNAIRDAWKILIESGGNLSKNNLRQKLLLLNDDQSLWGLTDAKIGPDKTLWTGSTEKSYYCARVIAQTLGFELFDTLTSSERKINKFDFAPIDTRSQNQFIGFLRETFKIKNATHVHEFLLYGNRLGSQGREKTSTRTKKHIHTKDVSMKLVLDQGEVFYSSFLLPFLLIRRWEESLVKSSMLIPALAGYFIDPYSFLSNVFVLYSISGYSTLYGKFFSRVFLPNIEKKRIWPLRYGEIKILKKSWINKEETFKKRFENQIKSYPNILQEGIKECLEKAEPVMFSPMGQDGDSDLSAIDFEVRAARDGSVYEEDQDNLAEVVDNKIAAEQLINNFPVGLKEVKDSLLREWPMKSEQIVDFLHQAQFSPKNLQDLDNYYREITGTTGSQRIDWKSFVEYVNSHMKEEEE